VPNHRERRKSPDPRIAGAQNDLRVDLYRRLLPQIQVQDQRSGAQGPVLHWNDSDAQWNKADSPNLWNQVGLSPIIQTLFWVLETLEGEELGILESLDSIVDPFTTPEELLDDLAASFGYALDDALDVDAKRIVVQGLFHAYKALGQRIAFDVFYRMVGFEVIKVFPLWKKDIYEANNDYSRFRYATTLRVAEAVGPAGNVAYITNLTNLPIKPGTVRITDGVVVLKDDPETGGEAEGLAFTGPIAPIIGPGIESGTINYDTGRVEVNFGTPSAGPVTADYESIDTEWPFHAARMDIEILMNPGGGVPIPVVDQEVVQGLLDRLDEIRPIHVLLRAFTLVFELDDTVEPTATDSVGCISILKDVRAPFGGSAGSNRTYMIDAAPDVQPDTLFISNIVGGNEVLRRVLLEDRTGFVCPGLDLLKIQAGGPETYW